MALDLRPLTLAELLDRSFSVYRRHFWLFVGIMAVPSVFALVAGLVLQILSLPAASFAPGSKPPTPEQLLTFVVPFVIGALLFSLSYLVVYVFALGATTVAVSDLYLGRDATIGTAYRATRPHAVRLLLLMLWTTLRVGGVFVAGFAVFFASIVLPAALGSPALAVLTLLIALIVFPGMMFLALFMTLRYAASVPSLMLERLTAGAAIRRSIALTRSNLLRIFVLFLCAGVIAYATALLFQGPFLLGAFVAGEETMTAFWFRIAGVVSGSIGGTFSAPFVIISLALMYYDVRIRKEAFDLQHMLSALEPPPAGAAVPAQS
jgi:Membrane domain of glycerophosphoryl diester phosphodiesterase